MNENLQQVVDFIIDINK